MSLRQRLRDVTGAALAEEAVSSYCQACGETQMVAFYEVTRIPVQTCVLLDSEDEAVTFPTGDLLLGFCERCGFIQNTRFDADLVDYSKPTEESQAFSPKFNQFADWLADELVERYRLEGKTVLEVGCGKGDFLYLLGERGIRHGLGIDPGYLPNRVSSNEIVIDFVRDWYGPEQAALTADLVLTRHLMEHVANVGEFFRWLGRSVQATEGAYLFTEVPDVARVLAEGAFWDVYYEHCSYFTPGSLARTLRNAGFDVHWLQRGFDDQYLLAGAHPGSSTQRFDIEESPGEIAALVEEFADRAAAAVRHWRHRISEVVEGGGSIAVWGGGSKAVAFLTSIGVSDVTVVDINPHKQGKWLPGVSVMVDSPQALRGVNPALVVAMNAIYLDEIAQDLAAMDLAPTLVAI